MRNGFYVILIIGVLGGRSAFAQGTPGFFLNDLTDKTAVIPAYTEYTTPTGATTTRVSINFVEEVAPVSKYIFGNNANVYMSQVVDQPVLIKNIKTLSPNVLRFPGGNISSVYLWNAPVDQPPADAPAKILDANGAEVNPGYWYGTNTAGWTMSVDNYYEMLEQTNSTGIITINYGYARYSTAVNPVAAAAHMAADWVRYDNGRTKFWEVGNESNGTWQAGYRINTATNQDGQPEIITGALYGKHFKVFADSMHKAAAEINATIYIGAQLLSDAPVSWWNDTDKRWNAGVFQEAGNMPDFYIVHNYYTPFEQNSKAADILATATTVTKTMMDYVTSSVAGAGLAAKPIALTEWNIFAEGSKQQVSYINGMHAAILLGELIKNKYGMAARWDLINGWNSGNDHGTFSAGDDPGGIPKWNPRAAFYYMYYFQQYFGDHMIASSVSGSSDVLAYASRFGSGPAGVVIVNKGTTEQTIGVDLQNSGYGERFYLHTLTGGTDNGEFSLKVYVNGQGPALSSGGPADVETISARSAAIGSGIKFTAPPRSVNYVLIERGDNVVTATEAGDISSLRIYPNPSSNRFRVDLPSEGFRKVEITDINGRQLATSAIEPSQTSVEFNTALTPGMYFMQLIGDKQLIRTKIVIE
jgi:hypothetical protein